MRQRLYTATFTPAEEVFIQDRIDTAVSAERERCAQIAEKGAKDCTEGDSEWHTGFRYAATNTALQIADLIRNWR
jgi:uncharacterized membrane protein